MWDYEMKSSIIEDPTRNLQIACGFFAIMIGWNFMVVPPSTPATTNATLYYIISRENWGLIRLLMGAAQMIAATFSKRHWLVRLSISQIHIGLCAFYIFSTAATSGEPAMAAGQIWLLCINVWIGLRALFDKEIDGTERRQHG